MKRKKILKTIENLMIDIRIKKYKKDKLGDENYITELNQSFLIEVQKKNF